MAAVAVYVANLVAAVVFDVAPEAIATLAANAAYATTLVAVTAAEIYAVGEISSLLNPPPKVGSGGSPTDFKADPQAAVPYAIGRTGASGNIVYVDVAGPHSAYLTYCTVLSLGPIKSIGGFEANQVLIQFTSDSGEGAGTGQQTTSLSAPAAVGNQTIYVTDTVGFGNGQVITVGGETKTISQVFATSKALTLTSAVTSAHAQYAPVLGPTTTSFYQNRMWWKCDLGGPNAPHLTWTATGSKDTPANHGGIPTAWTSSAKLSGLACTLWTIDYDPAKYPTGTPRPLQVVEGVFVYDPRLDSTYPGGSGSCRANNEATFVYSENPYLHALTWLIGRYSNGVATMGVHVPVTAIDMAAFVNGANIADANGWTLGGIVYSTDSKWDVLKAMLIAGAGLPVKRGATISCVVSAPQTSLDTLTGADVVGDASIPASASRRTRINGVWPRYREETQGWQIVPTAAPITVAAYVTADGEQRTRGVEYTLCQNATQASVLARYDIENAREFGPITLPCKPRWMGYRPGDCITINEPEYDLSNQKCMILNRSVDPATMVTTLTLRSETDAKHAFALGTTGSPPPAPALSSIDPTFVSTPLSSEWAVVGGVASSSSGSVPQIVVTGSCSDPNVASVIFEYQLNTTGAPWADWTEAKATTVGTAITGLAPATAYNVGVRYRSVRGVVGADTQRLILGPVTTGGIAAGSAASVPWPGVTDPGGTKPANNATVGAQTGLNLTSSTGALLGNADVINTYAPVGTNALVNSAATANANGFIPYGVAGTSGVSNYAYGRTLDVGGLGTFSGSNNSLFSEWLSTTSGASIPASYYFGMCSKGFDGNLADLGRYGLPCAPGDLIGISGGMAVHGGNAGVFRLRFFNASGSLLTPEDDVAVTGLVNARSGGLSGVNGDPANYYPASGIFTAPAGTAFATWGCYAYATGSDTSIFIFTIQPQLVKLPAGSLVMPAYTPGPPDRYANYTQEQISLGITSQGTQATANTYFQSTDPAAGGVVVPNGSIWLIPGGSAYMRNAGAWQLLATAAVRDGDILFASSTAGSGSYTIPPTSIGFVTVTIVAGQGGGYYGGGAGATGGGSGSYGVKHFAVSPGDVISYTIGAAGTGSGPAVGSTSPAGSGGASSLTCSAHSVSIATNGGGGASSGGNGTGGAAGSGGDTNTAGTTGGGTGIYAAAYVQIVAHST